MDDLKPRARALVDAARGALRPTAADHARVEEALRARLGGEALPPETGGERVAMSAGKRLALGLVSAGFVAGVAFMALRPGADRALSPGSPQAPSLPAPAAHVEPSAAAAEPAEPVPAVPTVPPPAAKSSAPRTDPLAQEVALLSRAAAQLRAGHAAQALKALDEHQRRFPQGALSEERSAARAQALCLSGDLTKGRAQLALLPPQSPMAAHARQVCDAGSLSTEP